MNEDRSQPWSSCRTCSFLLFLLCLNVCGTYFFMSGFLLTRKELSEKNDCERMRSYSNTTDWPEGVCWSNNGVDKVVLVVVDAFRFDFLVGESKNAHEELYKGHMPLTRKLITKSDRSIVLKFISDAPTTTMQRIKGLTTGGLPTFIDFSQSFSASSIHEDNIIHQLKSSGKSTWFVGDDTWMDLYPDGMKLAVPYPSFNVKDFHTVDDGVEEFFPQAIAQLGKWDLLIGHFLGVDHVGHIHSVDHEKMAFKLQQMDNFTARTITQLEKALQDDNNADLSILFLLVGDHGQTVRGEHGGATKEETETILFAHHLQGSRRRGHQMSLDTGSDLCEQPSAKIEERCIAKLEQIHFAATLSQLLDVPLPYGNLGSVSTEIFSLISNDKGKLEDLLRINAGQILHYLDTYSNVSTFSIEKVDELQNMYQHALEENGEVKLHHFRVFFEAVVQGARSEWVEFDSMRMVIGLAIVLTSLIVQVRVMFCSMYDVFETYFRKKGPSMHLYLFVFCLTCFAKVLGPYGKRFLELEGQTTAAAFFFHQCLIRSVGLLDKKSARFWILALLETTLANANVLANRGQMEPPEGDAQVVKFILGICRMDKWYHMTLFVFDCIAMVGLGFLGFCMIGMKKITCLESIVLTLPTAFLVGYRIFTYAGPFPSLQQLDITIPRILYVTGALHIVLIITRREKRSHTRLLLSVIPIMCLLHGEHSGVGFLYLGLESWQIINSLLGEAKSSAAPLVLKLTFPLVWYMFFWHAYFATGHGCNFQSLNFVEAYIGFREFDFAVQGTMLALATFSVPFLISFLLPHLAQTIFHGLPADEELFGKNFTLAAFSCLQTASLLVASSSAGYQRRHLMAWGMFAPKFVFDSLLVLTSQLGLVFGHLCVSETYFNHDKLKKKII